MNAELIESITKMIMERLSEIPEVPSGEPLDAAHGGVPVEGMVRIWDHVAPTSNPKVSPMKSAQLLVTEPASRSDPLPKPKPEPVKNREQANRSKLATSAIPAASTGLEPNQKTMVKLWDHLSKFTEHTRPTQYAKALGIEDKILPELETRLGVCSPKQPDALKEYAGKTPARIGIGRAGVRPKTETLLRFRLDHGAAVDAVYGSVPTGLLDTLKLFSVSTMVDHKEEYIKRPDLGRKLSEEAKVIIRERCKFQPKVQIVASDGLSSQAIEKNLEDVYLSFLQSLDNLGIEYGTPFYIEKGRVASMDEVGEILQPDVVVLFIGERPGLVSSESLSAYLCYRPRKGTIEADRMVISNIHSGGIPPVEAGAYLGTLVQKILKYQASGVSLVRKEG